jgi:hypothetical protein
VKKKSLFAILTTLIVAGIAVSAFAISSTTYTWEKTFEVTQPEIKCKIEVSNCKVVGYPVKICVTLKLGDDCEELWRECEEELKRECDYCEAKCCNLKNACRYQVNGTYSVNLHWWNKTQEDWQHYMYLQEETNITLTCWRHIETYTFIPEWEGKFKVVVTFTTETANYTFSSED